MAVTSPDNIWTPDAGDDYALTTDLAATADTVQDAITALRGGLFSNGGLMSARPAFGQEGRTYYATDTNVEWLDTGTSWVVKFARIRGNVNRSATATTFPASYTNVAANTFWTADVAEGLVAYNACWKIPLAGRYLVSYEIRATGAFLSGVSINYALGSPTLYGTSSSQPVQGVAATTISFTKKFALNDELRPYLLAASGTPSWTTGAGYFSIEWVGND